MQKGKAAHGFEEPICSWVPFLDNLFLVDIPNYSGKEKSMFVILNEGGQVTKKYDNYQICNKKYNVVNTWDSNTSIYKFKDFYTLKKVTNDTLFRLTKNFHIFPRYVFYLGKYRFPFEEYDGSFVNFMKEITNYITIISTIETTDYFFLLCDFGNHTDGIKLARVALGGQTSTYRSSIVKAVYQKSLDRLILLTPSINDGFINDIDGGMNFFPQKVINDSILVSWVDAYQLKAHVASSTFKNSTPKYPEKKKALEKLANSLNENDNPVLMLVKLK